METPLETATNSDYGNGRGDVLGHDGSYVAFWILFADGNGGWTTGDPLAPPAGLTAPGPRGMNDQRVVVGASRDPARCSGSPCAESPVVWLPDASATPMHTPWRLPLPVKKTGCTLDGSVFAKQVNDRSGTTEIVGVAAQSAEGRATCPTRPILWRLTVGPDDTSATVEDLPLPASIAGSKKSPATMTFETNDINDAGVVTGYVIVDSKTTRPICWWPCAVAPSGCAGTGWWVEVGAYKGIATDLDACGRTTFFGGAPAGIWETNGTVTPLPLPASLVGVAYIRGVLDITESMVAGAANLGNGNTHAVVWDVSACTPLPRP